MSTVRRLVFCVVLGVVLGNAPDALAAETSPSSGCPNQAIRNVKLPECRGYELVSPTQKNGEEVAYVGFTANHEVPFQAAQSGPGIAMVFFGAVPGSESATQVVPGMGTGGAPGSQWLFTPLAATSLFNEVPVGGPVDVGPMVTYSPSLSCAVQETRLAQEAPGGSSEPLLAKEESASENIANLYVWRAGTKGRELITDVRPIKPEKVAPLVPGVYLVDGMSSDCKHVAFAEATGGAPRYEGDYALPVELPVGSGETVVPPPDSLYEWSSGSEPANGTLALASTLPDSKPAVGVLKNLGETLGFNAVTTTPEEKLREFFTAPSDEGIEGERGAMQVFAHEQGAATTTVSASMTSVPDRGAKFYGASENGERVFFTANYGLAGNGGSTGTEAPSACVLALGSEPAGKGCDLYEYNVASHTLTDLSADVEAVTGDKRGANVRGVVGIAENGEYVYFSASGQLVPGKGNTEAKNEEHTLARERQTNVYAYHDGKLLYVATIGETEAGGGTNTTVSEQEMVDTIEASGGHAQQYTAARVSPSGKFMLLASALQQNAYDNEDGGKTPGIHDVELYEFHYPSDESSEPASLTCVSCNPNGAKPQALAPGLAPAFQGKGSLEELHYGSVLRNLLDDGRVFFDIAQANYEGTSSQVHVYEWQPAGFDGCVPLAPPEGMAAFSEGCTTLLDDGVSEFPSYFDGASADGENVYITTTDPLVATDPDGLRDLYDVRVDGFTPPVTHTQGCEENGTECQSEEGHRLGLGSQGSENGSAGQPPFEKVKPKGEVEAEVTRAIAVNGHSHKGNTITLVLAAPGAGKITVSGSGVGTLSKAVAKLGSYTLKLSLGKQARTAVKHHKKLKLKLRVSFTPSKGRASTATVTVTV